MKITIRSLTGDSTELDVEPTATIAELKVVIEAATQIPVVEQRLVFAGTQLEEAVNEAWRRRRGTGALSAALGAASMTDGTPLTLEHYAVQKGSVINIVRRIISSNVAGIDQTSGGPGVVAGVAAEPVANNPAMAAPDLVERVPEPVVEQPPGWPEQRGGYPGQQEQGRGGAAGRRSSAEQVARSELTARLDALSDVDLHALLAPMLERRPALKASLMARQPPRPVEHQPPARQVEQPAAGLSAYRPECF